jgi:hypothetical protein
MVFSSPAPDAESAIKAKLSTLKSLLKDKANTLAIEV